MKSQLWMGVLPFIMAGLISCQPSSYRRNDIKWQGKVFDTTYSIRLVPPPSQKKLLKETKAEMKEIFSGYTQRFSQGDPLSEISQFNLHQATTPFIVSSKMLEVVEKALLMAKETNGAFDPAYQLKNGYQQLDIKKPGRLIKKSPQLELDLYGIVKGMALDEVFLLLQEKGFRNFLVEIGGEVRVLGLSPKEMPWEIGIEEPDLHQNKERTVRSTVFLSSGAIATSGTYRQLQKVGGKIKPHIINPHSRNPIDNQLVSASVFAPTAMQADAVATAIMVMGQKKALSWVKSHKDYEAFLLTRKPDGTIREFKSSGWKKHLAL